MNKLVTLIVFLPLFVAGQTTKYESIAKKLTNYFLQIHGQDSVAYQKLFFESFPDNFRDFKGTFGYFSHKNPSKSYGAPLSDSDYITPFFDLKTISERNFYQKIINIAIGGSWDADAINFFQYGLQEKVLRNPKLTFTLLKAKSSNEIKSFFFFFFHGIHPPYENIPDDLQAMKTYDSRVYALLEQGFKKAIGKSGHACSGH